MPDPPVGGCGLDRFHVLVEPDPEVRVVPGHDRAPDFSEQEGEILGQLTKVEWLVVDGGIDTEAAAIRAPQARDHGDDLDRRCLVQRCFNTAPTGRETGELRRLPGCRQTAAEWPLRGAFGEQLLDDPAVGESEYVIEVALRVLGVAARMWAAERGDGAALPEQV